MRLVADAVDVRFPRLARPVLAGVSLSVEQGETLAVVGPSGSGKSTLLSVLGGLVRPSSGTVRVDGGRRDVRDVSAWVLQTVNVLPERTALENVALGALTRGLRTREARWAARERLESVGLADLVHSPARLLSGGELQRVVIARALASGRPFLLADEPTGQLDRSTSLLVLDALFTSAAGAGVVVVTHDPEVAARCGRAVRIDDGRVSAA